MATNNNNNNNNNNDNSNEEDDANKKPAAVSESQQKRRQLFDSLHEEMEIAQYSTSETGQQRRKTPRKESAVRNKKRKLLEKVDHQERATERDYSEQRMRGSKKSLEQNVVDGSQVLYEEAKDDEVMEVVEEEGSQEEEDDEVGDEGEEATDKESSAAAKQPGATAASTKPSTTKTKGRKRLMYRMRNFKSARMAERHGDALGAHARGQSLQAVRKLEQVAVDAPTAPQVYSSLGMVYESLLSDSRNKSSAASQQQEALDIKDVEKQLELAKKAYGSYHVAALLCKKDFSLWVRAGDTAKEIANLCTEAMLISPEKREDFRQEKLKWMQEAKKDYLAADNQRPPGIDVPAKLAAAQMELGNLSEALVILTDLKNRSADAGESHSEFEKSYTAWLLYSDLMLRIGHECIQWNEGNQQNENYMFRRWLRKWSGTFDWKERRLQALVFALEAAAGTRSCHDLIQWSKNRAAESNDGGIDHRRWHVDSYEIAKDPPGEAAKQGEQQKNGESETAAQEPSVAATTSASLAISTPALSLERARQALFTQNELELRVFDEETQNLGLVGGSDEWNQRAKARSDLVKSHRASVVDLVGNYERHHSVLEIAAAAAAAVPRNDNVEHTNGNTSRADSPPLPLTASCAAVCSIASELMKHCLRFEQFEGCRLVGEAVSAYLKQRAELLERRLESNRTFAEKQKSTSESVLLSMEAYDEVGDDESDDDADALYLSDDEVILESSDENLVPSLKNGILPPELRFLYGLGLINETGKTFLAKQCLKAIEVLEADDMNVQIHNPTDTDIVKDPLWYGFRQGFTEPLKKTVALELAVDALRKVGKEAEFADSVAPLLETHLENLQSTGQMNIALFGDGEAVSNLANPLRDRVINLIVASARIQIERAKSIADTEEEEATEIAYAVLDRVIPLLQNFWKVESNGSIPSFCVSGLELLVRTFNVLLSLNDDGQVESQVLAKLLDVLSLVCGVVIADPLNSEVPDAENPFNDAKFPVNSDWQKLSHELLSKRLYNIAIGCIVSNFSGWETDEFTLEKLRTNAEKRHFGVHIGDERVTGYLSPSAEAELAKQWEQIVELVPQFSDFDFKARLDVIKKLSWYKERVEDVDKNGKSLSVYGEKDAFELFLMLSRLCLKAANSDSSDLAKYFALVKLALSVVLPLSEFCLDMNLWDSKLGKAAVSETTKIYDWSKLAKAAAAKPREQQASTKRGRTPTVAKPPEPPVQKGRVLATMIRIPVSALLSEWNEGHPAKPVESTEAVEAMRKLNDATKMLRECYTESAIQKGCLQVALLLMDLVAKGYCYNPFLCLQQAAIFASQGPKGGNNDEPFKEGLPKERECSPEEALVIVGRADCLQSLLFADEAVYLCSYVARVCRMHRNRQLSELEWNSKWKVVGICMYNLSVAIRLTRSFQDKDSPPEYWDENVAEEMTRARQDAIAMRGSVAASAAGVAAIVAELESGLQRDDDDIVASVRQPHGLGVGVQMMDTDEDDEEEKREVVAV